MAVIESGGSNSDKAKVNAEGHLLVKAITEAAAAHASHEDGKTYIFPALDAGPVGGEFTLYIQNTSDSEDLVIDTIVAANVDADVVWALHEVTGTAGGAAVITAANMNLSSGNVAPTICRGGAGGVTGLASAGILYTWYGGSAYQTTSFQSDGKLVMGKNKAIAIEFDAGTGGAVALSVAAHFISRD